MAITAEQSLQLATLMEPLFVEAEATGKWLASVYFGEDFSPKHLRALQAKGGYVQGPDWWKLVSRPGFVQHQGEWDTITLEEHERLRVRA